MNPHHSIPAHSRLQVSQITCWVDGGEKPKVVGSPQTEAEGNVFTCWIESVVGQEYAVNWHNNYRDLPLEGRLYVDGILCDIQYMPDRNHMPDAYWATVAMNCAQISDRTRGTFHFADLQDDEDEEQDQDRRVIDASQIGTIRLEVRRIHLADYVQVQYTNYIGKSFGRPHNLAEAAPHRTRFGKPYEHPPRMLIGRKAKSLDRNPWYTFIFRYRPLRYLLAYRLMPPWYTIPQPPYDHDQCLTPTSRHAQLAGPATGLGNAQHSYSASHSASAGQNYASPSFWNVPLAAPSVKRKRDQP